MRKILNSCRLRNSNRPGHKTKLQTHASAGLCRSKLDFTTEKLSRAARLFSSITLFNNLTSGHVDEDDLIAELLNIETGNLGAVEKYNKSKADAFIKQYKDTKQELDFSYDDLYFVYWNTIQLIWNSIGNLSIHSEQIRWNDVSDISNWNIEWFKGNDPMDLVESIRDETSSLDDIKTKLKKLASALTEAPTINTLKTAIATMENVKPFYKLAEISEYIVTAVEIHASQNLDDHFRSNVKILSRLSSVATPEINAIISVLNSHFSRSLPPRQATFGFLDGFKDLRLLFKDTVDTWLLDVVGSNNNLRSVRKLIRLKEEFRCIDDKWMSLNKQEHYLFMHRIASISYWLSNFVNVSGIESFINKTTEACGLVKDVNSDIPNLKYNSLLPQKLHLIGYIVQVINNKNGILDKIDDISDNNSSDFKKISGLIMSLRHHFEILKSGDMKKEITEMMKYQNAIPEIVSGTKGKSLLSWLKCQNNFSMESVDSAAKLIVEMSGTVYETVGTTIYDTVEDRFDEVSTVVETTSGIVKNVRLLLKEIKNQTTTDLRHLKNLDKYSKTFGEAVKALVSIKKAFDHKDDFEKFIEKGMMIQKIIENLKSNKYTPLLKSLFGNFRHTVLEIATFFYKVDTWADQIVDPKKLKFHQFGDWLAKLASFEDINLQLENRLIRATWWDDIYSVNKTVKVEFEEAAFALSKLDLKFSVYKSSLLAMPRVMRQIEKVLKNETIEVQPEPIKSTYHGPKVVSTIYYEMTIFLIAYAAGNLLIAAIWCYCEEDCLFHILKRRALDC
eukprot:NP_494180.1 Uncharacterized protein CELE_T16A1.2 [Caenorhabditis elegans]